MSGTLWIDLTDLRVWGGHHTGVQRVVAQLATRFAGEGDVRYFAFDSASQGVREVSLQTLTESPGNGRQEPAQHVPFRQRLGRGVSELFQRSPRRVQRQISADQRAAIRRAGGHLFAAARDVRTALRGFRSPSHPPAEPAGIAVSADDSLLVLGKVWDEPLLVAHLARLRTFTGCRLHVLIYDLIPVYQPQLFGPGLFRRYAQYLFDVCTTADSLLAISQSTRRDLQRFCDELLITAPPIEVVRLGEDAGTQTPEPVEGLEPGFVLAVGTIEVRKNHALLYSVWKLARARGIALPRLVIVGGSGWLAGDVLHLMRLDPEVRRDIVILQDVSDAQLAWLYGCCRLTVYPSMYEGWGLPVAESLARGKVCVTSNTSSMPEIAGDLVDYFSPYDAGECLRVIAAYLDDGRRAAKESEIRERYRRTTWDDTFGQMRSVLGRPRGG